MKDKLKELEPDIRNITYRGISKYFPDSKIGPITYEKYCSSCGKKIINPNTID